MRIEEIEFESVLWAHIKIFMFLATKYLRTLSGYDREDLIHEQMLACYKAMEKYDQVGNISSFLYAVSENKLKSLYRADRRQKRKPKQLSYIEGGRYEEAGLMLADKTPSVEQVYYIEELKVRTEAVAQQNLSKFEYYLYIQIIKNSKSVKQVANELGKTEKQIANGMTRVRSKLREKRELILCDI
ncbi:sigma-70 family RNA polymerase sigma factor [Mollicutes bacterium LVI A0039]|nr:sigma-70 family RNA polymerase sigma factor [Mollicutes bacterium LVI A0039]